MIQPFDENDVLFRFVPSGEEARDIGGADEIVLVHSPTYPTSIFLYVYRDGNWRNDVPWVPRVAIARLLKEREAQIATLAKVEIERDFYRSELWHVMDQALEEWASDRARDALEEGTKMRES